MEIEHNVYINQELKQSFLNSNWYDTASPYQWCINALKNLKDEIDLSKRVEIISNGVTYKIINNADFKNWIEQVFFGGFEKYVFD
ncbi:hypothetical protein [Pedobacter punctiformis]|uniref:Uncharacterized protein n=1 Tax=Pedobacter punctiformis TaxID=3004097 RepID=A0ABT4L3P0_9SPHI|nr:hypothetical protein [Pedobacter sp. HCMS5-2]MCZ4242541.1 hypothetical protein [Pedobacter sp. HCMS5-2]